MGWMASDVGKYFEIEGGNMHSGYKEHDAAIADCLTGGEGTESYNGGEDCNGRQQTIRDTLVVANDDRRREYVGSRPSEWRGIQ